MYIILKIRERLFAFSIFTPFYFMFSVVARIFWYQLFSVTLFGLCQTSGLPAAGAKRVARRGTAFERVCIDSYVKRWLMSHERATRLAAAGKTPVLT